jgi:hypothetical protein
MRVEVVRSGGFAGRVLRWSVEVDQLPAESASELRRLLDEAQTWAAVPRGGEARAASTSPAPVADGFRWRVVADTPEQPLELAFTEPASEPARRLVDLVRAGASSP